MKARHCAAAVDHPFHPEVIPPLLRQHDVVVLADAVFGLPGFRRKVRFQIGNKILPGVLAIAGAASDVGPINVGAIDAGLGLGADLTLHVAYIIRIIGATPGLEALVGFLAVGGVAVVGKAVVRAHHHPGSGVGFRFGAEVVGKVIPLLTVKFQQVDLLFLRLGSGGLGIAVQRSGKIAQHDVALFMIAVVECFRRGHHAVELRPGHRFKVRRPAAEGDGHMIFLEEFRVIAVAEDPVPPVGFRLPPRRFRRAVAGAHQQPQRKQAQNACSLFQSGLLSECWQVTNCTQITQIGQIFADSNCFTIDFIIS